VSAKPRLLDLFSGAGGCARGYQLAGFHVTGVDNRPQPRYVGDTFILGDALEYCAEHGHEYDAIHASPPCQHHSKATAWRGSRAAHPELIAPTRERLIAARRPFVIENVPDARRHLRNPIVLCGTALGLAVQRHRYFELPPAMFVFVPRCCHRPATDYAFDHGHKQPESVYRDAMGCECMTVAESRQAIPPTYTEFIGLQLLNYV
jgi:hypothetical protein